MKRTLKKIFASAIAMIMALSLAAPALAAEETQADTVRVTVMLQRQDKDATKPTTLLATSTIQVPSGTTVYDLIKDNVSSITATSWKTVDIIDDKGNPTGETGEVLNSLTYTIGTVSTTLTNWGGDTPGSTSEAGTYEGQAWGYTVNGTSPVVYMDQYELTTNSTIILNYQYSSFSWPS